MIVITVHMRFSSGLPSTVSFETTPEKGLGKIQLPCSRGAGSGWWNSSATTTTTEDSDRAAINRDTSPKLPVAWSSHPVTAGAAKWRPL